MKDKVEVARYLAEAHLGMEPEIRRIVRLVSDEEDCGQEPLKLLEVNPDTPPFGIVPLGFAPDPPRVPFPFVLIEVTPGEFEEVSAGRLALPHGWRLDETIYAAKA
jgi:hypothetical protein